MSWKNPKGRFNAKSDSHPEFSSVGHEGDTVKIQKISGMHNKKWTGKTGTIIKIHPQQSGTWYTIKCEDTEILLFEGEFEVTKCHDKKQSGQNGH